jgi:hypothetical protein
MAPGPAHSFVFAIDFSVPQPDRVWPVLEANRQSFISSSQTASTESGRGSRL